MQDKTLDMLIFLRSMLKHKNFSDNLGACQTAGGRLSVDNRRYRLPVRLHCCRLHCKIRAREKKVGNKLDLVKLPYLNSV